MSDTALQSGKATKYFIGGHGVGCPQRFTTELQQVVHKGEVFHPTYFELAPISGKFLIDITKILSLRQSAIYKTNIFKLLAMPKALIQYICK